MNDCDPLHLPSVQALGEENAKKNTDSSPMCEDGARAEARSPQLPPFMAADWIDARRRVSGRFQPGNLAAMKTGLRAKTIGAGPGAVAALQDRVVAITSDLGGEDVSQVAAGVVRRHAQLEAVAETLWADIEARGLLTGKGRQRAALSAYLAVSDRLARSAALLGLSRRQKRVPSVAELLDGRPERA